MKNTLLCIFALVAVGLMVCAQGSTLKISDLTQTEYNEFVSGAVVSTSTFQAGGSSGPNSKEIVSSANISVSTDHVWPHDGVSFRTTPEPISINYDLSGNWISSAGSNSVVVQPLAAFNAVLVRVWYQAQWEPTVFENVLANGMTVRDMSAGAQFDSTPDSDQLIIYMSDGAPFDEFEVTGDFSYDFIYGSGNNVKVDFIAINDPLADMIPEPGVGALAILTIGLVLLRRKR